MPAVTRFKIEKRQHVAMDRAEETVMRIGRGYQLSQALYVAAKLGVADARLRAAGGGGHRGSGGRARRFATNDAAEALRADAPGRMRDVVINFGEEMYRAFGDLLHTVRTGETAFDAVFGASLFEYYAANPQAEASAAARMLARTLPVASEFAASDVLRDVRTLVDVGGGTGTLLAEVLGHRPTVGGVLLERPGMVELAHGYLADHGVADSSAASPSCRAAAPRWIEPRGCSRMPVAASAPRQSSHSCSTTPNSAW